MKKLLFLALALGIMSCSTDEENINQPDCGCGVIIEKNYFSGVANFTILKVKNNCTGQITTIELDGNVGTLNGQYCF